MDCSSGSVRATALPFFGGCELIVGQDFSFRIHGAVQRRHFVFFSRYTQPVALMEGSFHLEGTVSDVVIIVSRLDLYYPGRALSLEGKFPFELSNTAGV